MDANAIEFLENHGGIVVFDRNKIAAEFIDIEKSAGIESEYIFSTSYAPPLQFAVGDKVEAYVFPASASELVELQGIADGSLFSKNVRLALGNTRVNKGIRKSVEDKNEHLNFSLYHNGITLLCSRADYDEDSNELSVENYVVVNGAQSLSTLFKHKKSITENLRILLKVVQLSDDRLADKITNYSNNQNAIKARDLRSNHDIQTRLKSEFHALGSRYSYVIKQGEAVPLGKIPLTNEEAGLLLLAFDLGEPFSCHQKYKVFDEKYADIFQGPHVNALRILFIKKLMLVIEQHADQIKHRPFAKYGLTKYFLLHLVATVLRGSETGKTLLSNPGLIIGDSEKDKLFYNAIGEIISSFIIDINYDIKDLGEDFDYKSSLKAPLRVMQWRDDIMRSYEKDKAKGKVEELPAELLVHA